MGSRPSARAVIIQNDAVALMERRRAGRHYFAFPGGGVEAGESSPDAVVREVREELGLVVAVRRPIAYLRYAGDLQTFFLVAVTGGDFGSGDGPEFGGGRAAGNYTPVWLPVSRLSSEPVLPRSIARLIVDALITGWPASPPTLDEPDDA